jgi:hypothetical protein
MKVHMEDIRLYNNAGMSMPICYANAPMLDLDKSRLSTSGLLIEVTCLHCKRMFPKRYPWARGK